MQTNKIINERKKEKLNQTTLKINNQINYYIKPIIFHA